MKRNISGGSGKVSVIVTAAVALTGFISLVASCLRQFLSFGFQQFIEGFLYAATN